MLVIGWIIKNMDLAFNTIPMAISMKVAGKLINVMGRVLIGLLIQKTSSEDSTQETGKVIKSKEEELCSTKQEIDMMECGWIICLMERAE
jgi:hypothetical protein